MRHVCLRAAALSGAILFLAAEFGGAEEGGKTMTNLTVRSTAFSSGATIPAKYTGEGQDLSPPLEWSGVPATAKEIAIICDDPDAPRREPWVHWVAYKIPASTTSLPEGARSGFVEGRNDFGQAGYGGPMPPRGHGVHHYHFKLYALDQPLDAAPGLGKSDVLKAIRGHIVAEGELIGTYERR